MSIIMALLAALGGVGALLWRLNNAADATRNIAEAAGDISNMKRRWSWRRKAGVDPMVAKCALENLNGATCALIAAGKDKKGTP